MNNDLVPNPTRPTRTYAWFTALEQNDFHGMDMLLARGVSVDVPHPLRHTTALMEATRLGRIATVNWLLVRNATPAFLCGAGMQNGLIGGTPMHCALRLHHWSIAAALLKATRTTMIADDHGCTPLHILAIELDGCPNMKGATDLALKIIEKGCPLDAIDREGITALHYAAIGGHTSFAEVLLKRGASPNIASPDTGVTALTIAALDQNSLLASILIQYGANPNQPMADGKTPAMIYPALIQPDRIRMMARQRR